MFNLDIEKHILEDKRCRSATLTHPALGFGFKVTVEKKAVTPRKVAPRVIGWLNRQSEVGLKPVSAGGSVDAGPSQIPPIQGFPGGEYGQLPLDIRNLLETTDYQASQQRPRAASLASAPAAARVYVPELSGSQRNLGLEATPESYSYHVGNLVAYGVQEYFRKHGLNIPAHLLAGLTRGLAGAFKSGKGRPEVLAHQLTNLSNLADLGPNLQRVDGAAEVVYGPENPSPEDENPAIMRFTNFVGNQLRGGEEKRSEVLEEINNPEARENRNVDEVVGRALGNAAGAAVAAKAVQEVVKKTPWIYLKEGVFTAFYPVLFALNFVAHPYKKEFYKPLLAVKVEPSCVQITMGKGLYKIALAVSIWGSVSLAVYLIWKVAGFVLSYVSQRQFKESRRREAVRGGAGASAAAPFR